MWLTNTGLSRTIGLFAFFPMTVLRETSAPSSRGKGSSWAPRIRMSSNLGTFASVSMAPDMLLPVSAMAWMSSMTPPSRLTRAGGIPFLAGASASSAGAGSEEGSAEGSADSSPTLTKALFGEPHSGHTQSSGRSSNLTGSESSS